MKDLLVGSTGFVGGNLMDSHEFIMTCHSSDIEDYYGSNPDLCIYAGVPAAMFLANSNPDADLKIMKEARENIRKINPKKLVLISTIAVYRDSKGNNEESDMEANGLPAYGYNRLQLEKWIREDIPNALIIRLPALYGKGLKKNFLYDFHTITPAMLNEKKYNELSVVSELVMKGYSLKENGFFCLNGEVSSKELKEFFINNNFNALSFTDSRSRYQFYNLKRLWNDITIALENDLKILNLCTPPVTSKEVYEFLNGNDGWNNELNKEPFDYDLHSRYSELLGGNGFYLCTKEEELEDIRQFMEGWNE